MVESTSLKHFGFNFCGPIVYSYIKKVSEYLDENPKQVYCLAREGYLLKAALQAYLPDLQCHYLLVSRTFLFRILLSDEQSWPYSLGHAFEGELLKFFVSRFGFTHEQAVSFLKDNEIKQTVSLPEDASKIEDIFRRESSAIESIIKDSRSLYLSYLSDIGLTSQTLNNALLLDVGYSGTIQKLLSILLSSHSHGMYFITTDSDNSKAGNYTARLNYVFKDKVKMGNGYTLLDRSMFLESLFTSPDGQFLDLLVSHDGSYIPCYGKRNYTQHHFDKLNLVFQGVLDAIKHYRSNNIDFSVDEIESLYALYVSKRHLLPSVSWPLFEFDDAISGFGNVNSLQFFGM
ncbi:HAD family hydrolase [Aestuariibacter sp. GS-14]|uniref:HAD family hydrolase n=1 Tax=Aestuariibacter sp. GS-14 TaxID=2590670 RepID=UPI00112DE6DB|nr:HAD family hydrolase [Aestuariibacter sp. GS-14]TPV55117.1 HAD family hydrolase [Aestuariibacter sp. GS-14]